MAITKVEYYSDDILIGTRTVAPFDQLDYTFTGIGTTKTVIAKLYVDGVFVKETPAINLSCIELPGIDPDYQLVLDYATANTIPLPTEAQQTIDSDFLIAYKATGAWDRDDVFLSFRGTSDPAFKRIDWKRLVQVSQFGGTTWDTFGVVGNSTDAYVDTLYTPSTDMVNTTINSTSVLWNQKDTTVGARVNPTVWGVYSNATPLYYFLARPNNVGNSWALVNGDTAGGGKAPSTYNKAGFSYITKLNTTSIANGQSVPATTNGAPDRSVLLFNYLPTYFEGFWGGTVGYFIIGSDKSDLSLTNIEAALETI